MKRLEWSNLQISDFCQELSLLLHAGVGTGAGMALLSEEEPDRDCKKILGQMAHRLENGAALSDALREAGCFPACVTGMVKVGEHAGRTEEALAALSRYYEERGTMDRRMRSALTYPAVLLLLMMAVIVILLTRVLPVFEQVYSSLGGALTGLAGGLLILGKGLDAVMPILCVILIMAAAALALFAVCCRMRTGVLGLWRRTWGDRGILRRWNNAHFAQALSMGMRSGLPAQEAVELATDLLSDVPEAVKRCRLCQDRLTEGESLSKAMGEAGLLAPAACRLLTLGLQGGSGDEVMEDIARRMSEEAQMELESSVSKVEPALVLITSILVGAILLSVMLPLMHIMTAIG